MKNSLYVSAILACVSAASNDTTPSNDTTVTGSIVTTSTEIVTEYTTYCPEPTTFTEGNKTYTATEATTITVTDCPCTRTHTYTTQYVTVCGSAAPSVEPPAASTSVQLANGASKAGASLITLGIAMLLLC